MNNNNYRLKPKMQSKSLIAYQAMYNIRRQFPMGITTWSHCSKKGCSHPSRGGAHCLECSVKDLAEVIGVRLAESYKFSQLSYTKLMSEIDQKIEEVTEKKKVKSL